MASLSDAVIKIHIKKIRTILQLCLHHSEQYSNIHILGIVSTGFMRNFSQDAFPKLLKEAKALVASPEYDMKTTYFG